MAKLNLDNFPHKKGEWAAWQKALLIGLTLGGILIIWYLITEANEARKINQAKMAESDEKIRAGEIKKARLDKAIAAIHGNETVAVVNYLADVAAQEAQNPPNTEGAAPFSEVQS